MHVLHCHMQLWWEGIGGDLPVQTEGLAEITQIQRAMEERNLPHSVHNTVSEHSVLADHKMYHCS